MLELQKTYGKTIHTWVSCPLNGVDITLTECTCVQAFDKHPDLPLGPPHLMMAYTVRIIRHIVEIH
jgi:hypothetical protein